VNLSNVFLVQFQNFSLSFSSLFQWLQLLLVHFRFHIRCISIHKLLYFNFFSSSFCTTFLSAGIATSISVHVFSLLFLFIISGLFAVTSLSVCTALLLLLLLLLLLRCADENVLFRSTTMFPRYQLLIHNPQ